MDNDNTLPLKVGKLPKDCYTSFQEFANDLGKVLSLAQDNKEIIIGAQGPQGIKGARGPIGAQGPAGLNTITTVRTFNIASGVKFVTLPLFTGWEKSIYSIRYNGRVVPVSSFNTFDASSGYVGVGPQVLIDALPAPTSLRVYLMFSPGITVTPDANFILHVTTLS